LAHRFLNRTSNISQKEREIIIKLLSTTTTPIRDIATRMGCTDKAVRTVNAETNARPDTKRRADNRFFYY
jgi:hypothetical protein